MRTPKKMTRVSAAVLGSVALLGGLAACSSDEVKDATASATDQAGSVAASATDKAGEAADAAKEKAGEATDAAKEGMSNLTDAAGDDVAEADLPASISDAAAAFTSPEGANVGAFVGAKKMGDAVAAEYENVTFVESPETNGPQPLIGSIKKTWVEKGALENPIGLPTAPEEVIDGGWKQTFTKDTMSWTSTDGMNYTDSYENQ